MVKVAIVAAAMTALQILAAERALTVNHQPAQIQIVSSDANPNLLKLGIGKAVAVDLPVDVKEILVADLEMVKVIPRTTRRVYVTGMALGKTNIFFFDNERRQIAALDVWVGDCGARRLPLEQGRVTLAGEL